MPPPKSAIVSEKCYWSILLLVLLGIIHSGTGLASNAPELKCDITYGNIPSIKYLPLPIINNNIQGDIHALNDAGAEQRQTFHLYCLVYYQGISTPVFNPPIEVSNIGISLNYQVSLLSPSIGSTVHLGKVHNAFNFKPIHVDIDGNGNTMADIISNRIGYISTLEPDIDHPFLGGGGFYGPINGGNNHFKWIITKTVYDSSGATGFGIVFTIHRRLFSNGVVITHLNTPHALVFNDEILNFSISAQAHTPAGPVLLSTVAKIAPEGRYPLQKVDDHVPTCATPNINQIVNMPAANILSLSPSGGGGPSSEGETVFKVMIQNCSKGLDAKKMLSKVYFFPLGGDSFSGSWGNGMIDTMASSTSAKGVAIQVLFLNPTSNTYEPVNFSGHHPLHIFLDSQMMQGEIMFKARYHTTPTYLDNYNSLHPIEPGLVRAGFKIHIEYH